MCEFSSLKLMCVRVKYIILTGLKILQHGFHNKTYHNAWKFKLETNWSKLRRVHLNASVGSRNAVTPPINWTWKINKFHYKLYSVTSTTVQWKKKAVNDLLLQFQPLFHMGHGCCNFSKTNKKNNLAFTNSLTSTFIPPTSAYLNKYSHGLVPDQVVTESRG